MTKTKRLPAGLKKKLQGSLESLSAKEAGRLYVIYFHEATRKGIHPSDYGPIKELWQALKAQVDRSKGKPEETEAVNRYNGLVFLTSLFIDINVDFGLALFMASAHEAIQTQLELFLLIQEDTTTEAIRRIRGAFIDQPKPLTREEYDWLMEWSRSEFLVDLGQAADSIADRSLTPDSEIGDYEAAYDAIYNALVEKLQAGELVGGESIFDVEIEAPILITDGTIPAWAALRMVWRRYVNGRGLRIYDFADYADFAPGMVDRVGGSNGDALDDAALGKLAADFYKDCRRRPWGKGLAAKADPDILVKLLTQSQNPLLHHNAPDLGRVDWAIFQKTEVDRDREPFETDLAATVASLNRLDADFRKGYNFASNFYQEHFYPTSTDFARQDRARLFRMMARLDTTRQPFTFDRKEEGMMSVSDLIGVKFLTPFEQKVATLRKLNNQHAGIKRVLEIIADRYFGGLPILDVHPDRLLKITEAALASANNALNAWLDILEVYPWEIDVSDLRPGEPEIDQDFVDVLVGNAIKFTRNRSGINESEALLFGEKPLFFGEK